MSTWSGRGRADPTSGGACPVQAATAQYDDFNMAALFRPGYSSEPGDC